MKVNSKFKELTLEQLQTRQKMVKGLVVGFCIVTLIAVFALGYFSAKSSSNGTIIMLTLGCSVTLLASSIYLMQVATELKLRNSK